jgi:glycosyltransferase involved in cell wall biosynthesis
VNKKVSVKSPVLSLVHHLRCSEMHPAWQKNIYQKAEKSYLDSVDGFIFNSQTTRESVKNISPLANRPWITATPGGDRFNQYINISDIEDRACQHGPLRLVYVGSLIPRKGLHTLIDALALLQPDHFILNVIGSSQVNIGYTRTLQSQIDHRGLSSHIHFHENMDDDELGVFLSSSHLMVVPSSYEGFGIVYLEGMGFGLPAISTTRGAAHEIIHHGECGYLVEPGDAMNLAEILNHLYRDRFLLAAMSKAARRRYLEFPGWEESMSRIHNFLVSFVYIQ